MRVKIIGIAGASGSGKTTIAERLQKIYGDDKSLIISSDHYYKHRDDLSHEERKKINFDHPDSIDFELLITHLKMLAAGKSIEMPLYDFTVSLRKKETVLVKPKPIIIVEGILIFHPENLFKLFNNTVFVDAPADLLVLRRLKRDIAERARSFPQSHDQYLATVRPMMLEFCLRTQDKAELVVTNHGSKEDIDISGVIKMINKSGNVFSFFKDGVERTHTPINTAVTSGHFLRSKM